MAVGGKRSATAGRRAMGAVSGAPLAVRQNTTQHVLGVRTIVNMGVCFPLDL